MLPILALFRFYYVPSQYNMNCPAPFGKVRWCTNWLQWVHIHCWSLPAFPKQIKTIIRNQKNIKTVTTHWMGRIVTRALLLESLRTIYFSVSWNLWRCPSWMIGYCTTASDCCNSIGYQFRIDVVTSSSSSQLEPRIYYIIYDIHNDTNQQRIKRMLVSAISPGLA